MKLSLKLWIYFTISSIVAVVLFVSSAIVIGKMYNSGYTHQTLTTLADEVINEVGHSNVSSPSLNKIIRNYEDEHRSVEFEWFSADGNILYSTERRTKPYTFSEYSNLFVNQPYSLWTAGQPVHMIFPADIAGEHYFLHLHLPSDAMKATQLQFFVQENADFVTLILPLLFFFITPYLFTYFFFTKLQKRLQKLNEGLSVTNLDQQQIIRDPSEDEIGQLTRRFNNMSERIRDQVNQIQEFENKRKMLIANISHDLRTPMTMIQGYAELLDSNLYQDEEEKKQYTEIILRRSKYMDQLLQKLFEISKLDTQEDRFHMETVNVSEPLRRIAADYVHVLESQGIDFDIHIPEYPIYMKMDLPMFERAVRNLIENAIQYGSSGKYLGIMLEQKNDACHINITDHGPGIPEELGSRVFERFFRGSSGREGEGIGIGLSIVKGIADAHKGTIQVISTPNEQTTFTLTLPAT